MADAGAVTVAGLIDTGLTINTLALAEGGAIRVIPGSVLRVTGGFSAATAITLDISAFAPDTPAQYVLELPAGAAIPQVPCVIQGANAPLYRAAWVGTRLKIGQPNGIMIKVL